MRIARLGEQTDNIMRLTISEKLHFKSGCTAVKLTILLSSAIVTSTQSVQSRYKISRSPFVFKSAKQFAQRTLAQAQDSGKTQDNRTNPACCIGTISNYHVNITLLRFANQSQSATACKTAMIDMHLIG